MNTTTIPSNTGKFPDKRPPYVRWTFYLICTSVTLLILLAGGLAYLIFQGGSPLAAGKAETIQGELRRDLAGKLLSSGLSGKAIEQYELYLRETDLPPERRASIAYTIGKLYMEEALYEDALSWLFQVEMLDPKTELAPEVGSKIVACLERLGRTAQAQYSLEARSSLNKENKNEFKGQDIVAQIGEDVITLKELDEAIDAMPDWMRQPLDDPAKKEAFLQQYVAEELLYRKAKRLELEKDPKVRKQAEQAMRQLLVQKVLESEIQDRVNVSPEDVALYYKAYPEKYREKEAYKIRLIRVNEDRVKTVQDSLKSGSDFRELAETFSQDTTTRARGGEVEGWIEEGMDPTGMGSPEKLWQALSGQGQGDIAGPVIIDGEGYLFQIVALRPPRTPDLEEVEKQVAQDLYQERMEKAYQELIRQSLKFSDVKFFPEVIREAGKDENRAEQDPAEDKPLL